MELKFFCDKEECQQNNFFTPEILLKRIKKNRFIVMDYFDIYDLDRPIIRDGKTISYERVCRECGEPLFNKGGKYSYHRRYCNNHTGYDLWIRHNWGEVSKNYARKIRDNNADFITQEYNRRIDEYYAHYKEEPKWMRDKLINIIICEECKRLCQIYSGTSLYNKLAIGVVNIHHKIPVHMLTWENINLIWDKNNLIALCEDCHHKKDHQLGKPKMDPYINFKKITEFIN